MKKPIRILGLDPGTTIMGWGVVRVDGPQIAYEASGSIVGKGGDRYGRIYSITSQLGRLLRSIKKIHEVGIETGFVFGKKGRINYQAILALAEARGAIVNTVFGMVNRVKFYAPATVKKAVTTSGRSDKDVVARWLEHFTRRTFANQDESDAVAVAFCHALKRKRKR